MEDVLSILRAAARLNWLERPKVSFPVLKGHPRAGMSGYNSSSLSAARRTSYSGTKGGVRFEMIAARIWSSELMVRGVNAVPVTVHRCVI